MVIQKPLRVGKTERYFSGSSLAEWLAGETLTSATVEPDTEFATLFGSTDIVDGVIGFFLTGVAAGKCEIHINYATATRSDCVTVYVIVQEC